MRKRREYRDLQRICQTSPYKQKKAIKEIVKRTTLRRSFPTVGVSNLVVATPDASKCMQFNYYLQTNPVKLNLHDDMWESAHWSRAATVPETKEIGLYFYDPI